MFNTKLTVAYKGTNYCGFQIQAKSGDPTIQEHINKALSTIFSEKIITHLCSRTDAGVHANGQVINFKHSKDRLPEPERLIVAVNAHLPLDIRVTGAEKMPLDFHSRYHAKGKLYSYTIDNYVAHRPLTAEYTCHVPHKLNFEKMVKGANFLVGTHDFLSFKGREGATKTSVRTISRLDLIKENDYIKIMAEGNGFLYNMVRIISGTLIQVGKGKLTPEDIPIILKARDRIKAGPTAPAQGLILEKIYY